MGMAAGPRAVYFLPTVLLRRRKDARWEHGQNRIFARAKSNTGPDGGDYWYELTVVDVLAATNLPAFRVQRGNPLLARRAVYWPKRKRLVRTRRMSLRMHSTG